MKNAGWFVLLATAGIVVFGTGTTTAHAQYVNKSYFRFGHYAPSADGHGEFPVGTDHHIGQFSFTVALGHNGPEGNFEFNEKNARGQNVQHILVRPIDTLTITGHTARIEGPTLFHDRHVRVRVIAVDDGEHHDSLSVRVVATDGPDAGKALYEVSGVLTSGAIHVPSS